MLKKNPLVDDDILNEIQIKEKDDKSEKVDGSKDDLSNPSSNFSFVDLFDTYSC